MASRALAGIFPSGAVFYARPFFCPWCWTCLSGAGLPSWRSHASPVCIVVQKLPGLYRLCPTIFYCGENTWSRGAVSVTELFMVPWVAVSLHHHVTPSGRSIPPTRLHLHPITRSFLRLTLSIVSVTQDENEEAKIPSTLKLLGRRRRRM